ncbi:MAG TPA: hypothetical protein ENH55_19810 [Aurantimonas coralicida]|uniref:ParB-like N-terminal domain-containing protein n=2 Tax=root TaxID=1 RepID=A0A9C9NDJ8_9HYPH|nr:hypothetical protein [Aurantimonas coralicida]HET99500.1 hypothetical protein [Aurantimonas coralicida]
MKKPRQPPASRFVSVPIDKITVGERQAEFQPEWAAAIAATLPDMGLKQPIEIAAQGDGYRLIAGFHRLEAAKLAGWADIPARIVHLDDANEKASMAIHEAMENLMRRDITALDRCAHLAAAKDAHDQLYPKASKRGPKTRHDAEFGASMPQFSFSKTVARQVGLQGRQVNRLVATWNGLSAKSRIRLRGTNLADKQSELFELSHMVPQMQSLVIDWLLAKPPAATSVADASAKIHEKPGPTPEERRRERYRRTMQEMPEDELDGILDGLEDRVRDFAERKGWIK